jgi:hypothetical protein
MLITEYGIGVTVVSLRTHIDLGVSNVMLTVLGVLNHLYFRA